MVHVKKCPLGKGKRGNATTEFYHDGKPQIYCYGWIDKRTDETIETCKKCPDWVYGEQMSADFEKHLREAEENEKNND